MKSIAEITKNMTDWQYGRLAARKNWLYPILLRNPHRNIIIHS